VHRGAAEKPLFEPSQGEKLLALAADAGADERRRRSGLRYPDDANETCKVWDSGTTPRRSPPAGGVPFFRTNPDWETSSRSCRRFTVRPKASFVNDPSAGSPTETLLRLLLPLNDQVRSSSRRHGSTVARRAGAGPRISLNHSIGSSDGRCVQRAGT
jgi:hypothetical protein